MTDRKIFAVTETFYQLKVATSCRDIRPNFVVHWDSRGDYRKNTENNNFSDVPVDICESRDVYRNSAIKALVKSDIVILGDFRSGVQLMLVFIAIFLRKKVILSEDGIVASIADLYDFSPKYINDGGIKAYKLLFLSVFRSFFRRCDRITVHPNFLRSIGRSKGVFSASLSDGGALALKDGGKGKRLLFVGQVYSLMGLNSQDVLRHLRQLSNTIGSEYCELLYSGHPKDSSLSHEDVLATGWSLVGSLDSLNLSNSTVHYDLVGITSTSLVSDYPCVEKVMLLDAKKMENKSKKTLFDIVKTQKVIQKIAQSENKKVSYLS